MTLVSLSQIGSCIYGSISKFYYVPLMYMSILMQLFSFEPSHVFLNFSRKRNHLSFLIASSLLYVGLSSFIGIFVFLQLQLQMCQITKTNVDVFLCDPCQINILLFSALNIRVLSVLAFQQPQ